MSTSTWHRVVDFSGIADRIALCVANEAARQFGWFHQPELHMESLECEYPTPADARNYRATFPLFGDRSRKYTLEINLYKQVGGKWENGSVRGEHLTGKFAYYMIIIIGWLDGNVPCVSLHNRQLVEIKEAQQV